MLLKDVPQLPRQIGVQVRFGNGWWMCNLLSVWRFMTLLSCLPLLLSFSFLCKSQGKCGTLMIRALHARAAIIIMVSKVSFPSVIYVHPISVSNLILRAVSRQISSSLTLRLPYGLYQLSCSFSSDFCVCCCCICHFSAALCLGRLISNGSQPTWTLSV